MVQKNNKAQSNKPEKFDNLIRRGKREKPSDFADYDLLMDLRACLSPYFTPRAFDRRMKNMTANEQQRHLSALAKILADKTIEGEEEKTNGMDFLLNLKKEVKKQQVVAPKAKKDVREN